MNKFTRFGIALGLFAISFGLNAQSNQTPHKCSTNEELEYNKQQHPEIQAQYDDFKEQLATYLAKNKGERAKAGDKRIIPVVFHIIHECGPENISRAQIEDQIRVLNEDFSLTNPNISITPDVFRDVAADCAIEFRLATKDDLGNCSDGIVRVYSPKSSDANNANGVKEVSHWNSTKYLNVWVVKSIGSVQGTGGEVLGYAQFPFGGFLGTDGIVLRHDCVGSIGTAANGQFGQRFGRTATHEIGHWLGLRHIWGDAECGSDGIDDTPIAQGPNYGICWEDFPYKTTSCGRPAEDSLAGEMFMNYMDYSDDQCMSMFSLGQLEVMNGVLQFARANIIAASNTAATGTRDEDMANPQVCAPKPNFCENRVMICSGSTITYTDASYNAEGYTRAWEFEGGTPSTSTATNPTVTYANTGVYKAKLTVSNTIGTNSFEKSQLINVSSDVAENPQGPFSDYLDNQSNFNQRYLVFDGDDSNNKWEFSPWTGYGPANSCIRMINYNNTPTEVDAFVTPSYNMTTIPSPSMTFRISAAERGGTPADQLRFYTSTNCGQSWVLRKSWTGSALITAGYYSSSFAPTNTNQWQDFAVSLSSVASQSNVRFRFEFIAGDVGSNNVYLDDINIGTALSIDDFEANASVSLFPNPASTAVGLEFNVDYPSNVNVQVVDMLGKRVLAPFSGKVDSGMQNFTLDLNTLTAGIYVLQLNIDGHIINKKLIKN